MSVTSDVTSNPTSFNQHQQINPTTQPTTTNHNQPNYPPNQHPTGSDKAALQIQRPAPRPGHGSRTPRKIAGNATDRLLKPPRPKHYHAVVVPCTPGVPLPICWLLSTHSHLSTTTHLGFPVTLSSSPALQTASSQGR